MQNSLPLVVNQDSFILNIASKIARALANKEAKRTKKPMETFIQSFLRESKNSIKLTDHFIDRTTQRYVADEADTLYTAISRAVRSTSTLSNGNYHKAVSQRFVDESGIVVVLERQGTLGAVLVTTYKLGEENLLSDEELIDLKRRNCL